MIRLKPPQWTVFGCDSRFRILVAGRRFGKTYLAMVELCRSAWAQGKLVWYVAPTYKQAKRVAWKPLKQMTRPYWASRPNETDLRIELVTGGAICLRGADNYDSLRGDGLDFLILDEYASIAQEAWTEVLRPALADKQGHAFDLNSFHYCHTANPRSGCFPPQKMRGRAPLFKRHTSGHGVEGKKRTESTKAAAASTVDCTICGIRSRHDSPLPVGRFLCLPKSLGMRTSVC